MDDAVVIVPSPDGHHQLIGFRAPSEPEGPVTSGAVSVEGGSEA